MISTTFHSTLHVLYILPLDPPTPRVRIENCHVDVDISEHLADTIAVTKPSDDEA